MISRSGRENDRIGDSHGKVKEGMIKILLIALSRGNVPSPTDNSLSSSSSCFNVSLRQS
jgi:hypothetical protein